MPTLAELAQLSDNAYVGYPQLQRQAARMKKAQAGRTPENLPDPRTYGFMSGLMGTSPDELGMSVLSPNTAPAKDAAYYGYQLSNLGQIAPAMMPATKAGLRMAGNAINDAMVYGTGPLARITPQPMRMASIPAYHGTATSKIGYPESKLSDMVDRTHFPGWFSENPELANYYATARNEGNPTVLPVSLNIKKPLKLNFDMNDRADSAYEAVKKLGLDPEFYPELAGKNWAHEVINTYTFKKAAQEAGYDALQVMEDGYKTYAPLKESGKQVKSRFQK
jgi:hypothetical protein